MSWVIDAPVLILLGFVSVTAVIPGTFMVLRRSAMVPDVVAHSVLPGMAVAAVISSGVALEAMMVGGGVAALGGLAITHCLQRYGRLDNTAALAMAIAGFFALGVLLTDFLLGQQSHLDVEHFLFGSLDLLIWPELETFMTSPNRWHWPQVYNLIQSAPPGLVAQTVLLPLIVLPCWILRRDIHAVAWDSQAALLLGYRYRLVSAMFTCLSVVVVALCLQSMGLALTVAMGASPAVIAMVCSPRLGWVWPIAVAAAWGTSWLGYGVFVALSTHFGTWGWSGAGVVALAQMLAVVAVVAVKTGKFSPVAVIGR